MQTFYTVQQRDKGWQTVAVSESLDGLATVYSNLEVKNGKRILVVRDGKTTILLQKLPDQYGKAR